MWQMFLHQTLFNQKSIMFGSCINLWPQNRLPSFEFYSVFEFCVAIFIFSIFMFYFRQFQISYLCSQTMHLTKKFVILWTYELESCEFILFVYLNRFTFCRILPNFNMVLCPFDIRHLFRETCKCVISNLYSLPVNVD